MAEKEARKDPPSEKPVEPAEYGLEQILASEDAESEARKRSAYRFTHDQLEHKEDRVDKPER